MARDILLIPHNHFDPTWRRCFDRPAAAHGVVVRSYAEVEAHCISRFLELAGTGYPFSEGQACVWRKYLERHPDKLAQLRELARKGQLDIMLAGEVVQDSNLPSAEGLVRNFLLAMPLYEALCGLDHRGLKLAWVEDAFGNSPNYPQILRGVGAEVVCQLSYRSLPDDVWVGIDGTKIPTYDRAPKTFSGAFEKHPPCESCRGQGCDACGGAGMRVLDQFDLEALKKAILNAVAKEDSTGSNVSGGAYAVESKSDSDKPAGGGGGGWCGVMLLTEEILPDQRIPGFIEEINRELAGRARVRLGNPSDLYEADRARLEKAMAAAGDTPSPDLNPGMPGCYVSRIKCKQLTKDVSYALIRAEAKLAGEAWAKGQAAKPPEDLNHAWRLTVFNHFHDAITGTHIDNAYVELMDMLSEAAGVAGRYGEVCGGAGAEIVSTPESSVAQGPHPNPPPAGEGMVRIGNLDVAFDLRGIQSIHLNGKDLCGTYPAYASFRRPIRPGELVLEADFGDAWGQRIAAFPSIEKDATQIALGDYHFQVEPLAGAICWRGRYSGGDPMVKNLQWTITCRASADGRRLDFVTEVDWDTRSRRLRVIFPVKSHEKSATYEVPFGFIDRTFDASKLDYSQWSHNAMEFPALHWVRRKIDDRSGVALLNKGLPCNRWIPGRFDLSLLRSPEWAFCAVEPGSYEFWDIDGQRDTGRHRFEYSLWIYDDGVTEADLTRAGYEYNDALPKHPFKLAGDAIVTAFKLAEDGKGWILRLQETAGREPAVSIDFGREVNVVETNLLEKPSGDARRLKQWSGQLRKHEIRTLRLA